MKVFFFGRLVARPWFRRRQPRAPPRQGRRVFLYFYAHPRFHAPARGRLPAPPVPRPESRVRISRRGRTGGVVRAARNNPTPHVISLGATAMDMSSWKSSLHAYGSITCTTFVRSLGFLQHSNVWFFKLATAIKPHFWHT